MKARVFCGTCLGLWLALAPSCRRSPFDRTTTPATGPASPTEVAPLPMEVLPEPPVRQGESADTLIEAVVDAVPITDTANAEDDLQSEEPEANPSSENVTLTLSVSPPVTALVMWGSKQVARVVPGARTVQVQRPRNMGPLDLDIRAEGFLPYHTRLYSDRNDKVSVRLVRPGEAPSLLGFRSSVAAAAARDKTK